LQGRVGDDDLGRLSPEREKELQLGVVDPHAASVPQRRLRWGGCGHAAHFEKCAEAGPRPTCGPLAQTSLVRIPRLANVSAHVRTPIHFGTDGWRALIADDFTFENVERVSQASADFWNASPPPGSQRRVVVGFDRRFLSDQFARRAADVLCANGFAVVLADRPTPTPAVSFAVKQRRAVGGVMITASHNPAAFNGYKLKTHLGGPADSEYCQTVEAFLDRNHVRAMPVNNLLPNKVTEANLLPAHYRAIKKLVDFKRIARSNLRLAHDALFGVGAGCFDDLLAGTTCRVTTLNGAHDPNFGGINPEPVEANYHLASACLKRHPHDFCLVTDGDADRVGAMDGRGGYLSTHTVIGLLLHHLLVNRGDRGRVVKALTTTTLLEKMCAEFGLELVETPVGFKHIAAEMLKGGVLLGGEESGGIGFAGHIPERDGLLAGLMLLELLATERVSVNALVARLEKRYGRHCYGRIDTRLPFEERAALMEFLKANPPTHLLRSPLAEVKSFDGVKFVAQDSSWLMLRGSGTEPVLRIYAETSSEEGVRRLLRLGIQLIRPPH
jgi:phosphomannomutase